MDGWMSGCTFLCWMVKLTGSVRLVLFTDVRITVKTSEFISVLFSVLKYWWLRRLSMPLSVIKATAAEPARMMQQTNICKCYRFGWLWMQSACSVNSFSPLLALARAWKFISSVCPLAERVRLLSSSLSGLTVCRLKSWMKGTQGILKHLKRIQMRYI